MKEIPLTQGKVALVDDKDFEEMSKFKWCAIKRKHRYYAVRSSSVDPITHKRRQTQMGAVIVNTPSDMETDHINGNGLDNRRENLRVVTCRENQQNRHTPKSSIYPWVCWEKQLQKWGARLRINGVKKYLGGYEDEDTAGLVYAMACNAIEMGAVL
jgi:hypothetical protein